jgi:hypothetical protein
VSATNLIVKIDPDLGISRPQGDTSPRCSRCAATIDSDSDHLCVMDIDWNSGTQSIWVYCWDCDPAVRELFGLEEE